MTPETIGALGSLARDIVEVLLHCGLFGIGLTLFIWVVNRPGLIASAAQRYRLWLATLVAVLLLPLGYVGGKALLSVNQSELATTPDQSFAPLSANEETLLEKPATRNMVTEETVFFNEEVPPVAAFPAQETSWWKMAVAILPVGLLCMWLTAGLWFQGRLGRDLVRLMRLKRSGRPLGDRTWERAHRLLARLAIHRPVRFLASDRIESPVAVGYSRPAVILPAELEEQLDPSEVDHVLLHELAHLQRNDDWGLLFERLASPLFLLNPVSFWIRDRMRLEREMACDEMVVQILGRPHEYARSLVRLVSLCRSRAIPGLVSPAMESKSQMFRRFEVLLKHKPRTTRTRTVLAAALALLMIGATVTVSSQVNPLIDIPDHSAQLARFASSPGQTNENTNSNSGDKPVEVVGIGTSQSQTDQNVGNVNGIYLLDPAANSPLGEIGSSDGFFDGLFGNWFTNRQNGVSVTQRGDRMEVEIRGRDRELTMKMAGDVEFGDDDRSITWIERSGRVEITERTRDFRRELKIEPSKDGSLEFVFREDGDTRTMTDEDKEWMGETIITLIRASGMNVEERVARIGKNGGVNAVVDEVLAIPTDYGKRLYATELLGQFDLNESQLDELMDGLADALESDYETAEILIALATQSNRQGIIPPHFMRLAETIESSYELRRALTAFDLTSSSDEKLIVSVLRLAEKMESSYERAELLIQFADLAKGSDDIRAAYIDAALGITSDYELRRVLTQAGDLSTTDPQTVAAILEAATNMSSDYEKAELLIGLAPAAAKSADMRKSYFDAVYTMSSGYESRRSLTVLLNGCDMSEPDVIEAVVRQANTMTSDFETAELLLSIAPTVGTSPAAVKGYLEAVSTVASDYESGRLLKALAANNRLDDEAIRAYLKAVEQIGSNFEAANALIEIAPRCKEDNTLRRAYLDAADRLSSGHEQDRAYSAVGVERESNRQSSSRQWY